MADIVLDDRQQDTLRRLMALDAVPGSTPPQAVLSLVDRLVPCDAIEIDLADSSGYVIEQITFSSASAALDGLQVCDGPLMLGLVHQGRQPAEQEVLRHHGITDGVTLGFRCGPDHVVQLALDRYTRPFSGGDLAVLRMISPALQRLMRTRPTPYLPESLTLTERRVLQLVATGRSNSDIAADLFVAVATVRKHLEHAYRKLGVHNRMAAVATFEGRPQDWSPRAAGDGEKYA
jgi:DNA-binding CsgD family transcriptional regulator